jgi:hypothetical protein
LANEADKLIDYSVSMNQKIQAKPQLQQATTAKAVVQNAIEPSDCLPFYFKMADRGVETCTFMKNRSHR